MTIWQSKHLRSIFISLCARLMCTFIPRVKHHLLQNLGFWITFAYNHKMFVNFKISKLKRWLIILQYLAHDIVSRKYQMMTVLLWMIRRLTILPSFHTIIYITEKFNSPLGFVPRWIPHHWILRQWWDVQDATD